MAEIKKTEATVKPVASIKTPVVAEAKIAAEAVGIRLVPGIEIAVITEEGTGLHMLGYNIDTENEDLKSFLQSIVERRKERKEKAERARKGSRRFRVSEASRGRRRVQ